MAVEARLGRRGCKDRHQGKYIPYSVENCPLLRQFLLMDMANSLLPSFAFHALHDLILDRILFLQEVS
jgi:hypothetical protein